MGDKKRLEEQIRKVGGRYAEEIIGLVRALAEVDVRIKDELDEIERVSESLVRRHNELADRIDALVRKAVDEDGGGESDEPIGSPDEPGGESEKQIRFELRIIGMPDDNK